MRYDVVIIYNGRIQTKHVRIRKASRFMGGLIGIDGLKPREIYTVPSRDGKRYEVYTKDGNRLCAVMWPEREGGRWVSS